MDQKVIDIHCHPSLKTWLFPRHHVYDEVDPRDLNFSENLFVNIYKMIKGNVNVGVAVHYLPEAELQTDPMRKFLTRELVGVLELLCKRKLERVIEDKSTPTAAFDQIKQYVTMFEQQIEYAHNQCDYDVSIATGLKDLQDKLDQGKIVFIHSIEGLHCLGNGSISYESLEENLSWLYEKGICQITLAHFFENILVSSQGGIPPKIADAISYDPANSYQNGYNLRDNIGIRLIDKMLDLGIIIDLVHCQIGAKQMVYDRNNLRGDNKRPLVFSHTGIQEIALKYSPNMPEKYYSYLPDKKDIKIIKDCDGVLGIIFMDYWLDGQENNDEAIDIIIETIEYIKNVPDSMGNINYNHIAIGSDLDGFTEVPKDLAGEDKMPDLVEAIRNIPGITQNDIDNICTGNYMRVLKNGWGKK